MPPTAGKLPIAFFPCGDGLLTCCFSPTAPSPPNAVKIEFAHIQRELPVPDLDQSSTKCLNLNITTPRGASAGSNLPVIVFVHGGGFAIGSNSWPQYDFRRIVALSISEGLPVIGVNIKFAPGNLYFLACADTYLKLPSRRLRLSYL